MPWIFALLDAQVRRIIILRPALVLELVDRHG